MTPIGVELPSSESVARPLTQLSPTRVGAKIGLLDFRGPLAAPVVIACDRPNTSFGIRISWVLKHFSYKNRRKAPTRLIAGDASVPKSACPTVFCHGSLR